MKTRDEQLLHIADTVNCLSAGEDGDLYLDIITTLVNLLWEVNGDYKTGAAFSRTIKCRDLSITFKYKM